MHVVIGLNDWSADETNGNTKTLGWSHMLKAKPIAKSVNIEKCSLREPNTGLNRRDVSR